jgi:hypothetical protein
LSLPLIAPSQAQKHVTHNEALMAVDVALALHLEGIDMVEPPETPISGSAFGIGEDATGVWAGWDGCVGVADEGTWSFATPSRGWQATVGEAAAPHVHDGAHWRPAYEAMMLNAPGLGVGAMPDSQNAVVLRVSNILLEPSAEEDGVRLKLNRPDTSSNASMLLQTGYAGRAELRLGDADGFEIKVSDDGASWATCLAAHPSSAAVSFPAGVDARSGSVDLLLNGRFQLNQRGTPEGVVVSGKFVCDRWRAGPGGANWIRVPAGFRLLAGSLVQTVEPGFFGEVLPQATVVRCTVEGLSEGGLAISLGGQEATLSAQAPRFDFHLAESIVGSLEFRISPANPGAATFRSLRLHCVRPCLGELVRSRHEDEALCRRYFFKSHGSGKPVNQPAGAAPGTVATSLGLYYVHVPLPHALARVPVTTVCNPSTGVAGTWITGGGSSVTPTVSASDTGFTAYGSGAESGTLVYGHFYMDAEPAPAG